VSRLKGPKRTNNDDKRYTINDDIGEIIYHTSSTPLYYNPPRLNVKSPTVDSVDTVPERFFAGFTRVTSTKTNEEARSEVYKIRFCCLSFNSNRGCSMSVLSKSIANSQDAPIRLVFTLNQAWVITSTCPLLCHVARCTRRFPQRCWTSFKLFTMCGIKQRQSVQQKVIPTQALRRVSIYVRAGERFPTFH